MEKEKVKVEVKEKDEGVMEEIKEKEGDKVEVGEMIGKI